MTQPTHPVVVDPRAPRGVSRQLIPEVPALRHASRLVVRELGFLQDRFDEAGVSHSEAHAMMELETAARLQQNELGQTLHLDKSTTSRLVGRLEKRGFVRRSEVLGDARKSSLALSERGKDKVRVIHGAANARVEAALETLSQEDRATVLRGMSLYAEALRETRLLEEFQFRPIRKEDNRVLPSIIERCLAEFGAGGEGYVTADPEFHTLYQAYQDPRSSYTVVLRGGRVLGGGGVAPLKGGDETVCELQKMYLLPEARGFKVGQRIISICLATARELGYRRVYLETLHQMKAARSLYEKNGFVLMKGPHGATGHFGCDAFYERAL